MSHVTATTFRGLITDGSGSGSGGRLTKTGTGTPCLLRQNLDAGLTTVAQGRHLGELDQDSDHLFVLGDLKLDGIINIVDAGGLSTACFRPILTFTGALTNNGVEIGQVPIGRSRNDFGLDFSVPGTIGLTIVPEPATACPLIVGGACLAVARRRPVERFRRSR